MYIELIDVLRCPREHEETWLVAAFTRMNGRFVVTGTLGCPVCSASYPIENGVADLRDQQFVEGAASNTDAAPTDTGSAIRIAAMLGLTRPRSLIAIRGSEGSLAKEVSELTECRVIVLDGNDPAGDTERVATIRSGNRVPLATASLDGIVLTGISSETGEASRVLRAGGRLVASAQASIPSTFRELARDDRYIVAESAGPLVNLSR
jgi:uncharacterized protein YbaR (Trm112 family)